jgi:putative membrane protein
VKKFLKSWAINTLAVLAAVYLVPGIRFTDNNLWTPFIASLVLGILNAFIRPVLTLLALPLMIYTLGLFRLVINALLLYFVGFLLAQHFQIDNFFSAFMGALIISFVSFLLNLLAGASGARVRVEHRRRPPDSDHGGSGPVIDV